LFRAAYARNFLYFQRLALAIRGKTAARIGAATHLKVLTNVEGPMMLRVQTQQLDGALICRLEGRFTGKGAEEVRTLVTRCDNTVELVVDLTDVMFIDAIGEEVLLFVKRLGAQFVAETAYSRDVCERLQLPLVGKNKSNTHVPGNSNGNAHRRRQ
jgi:hypothetical protein